MTKVYIFQIVVLSLILLAACYWKQKALGYKESLDIATSNIEAYEAQLDSTSNESKVFQLTIDQYKDSNDSLLKSLQELQKSNKIKDSKISALGYRLSTVHKSDTINITDTIFKEPSFHYDTIVGDKWYSNKITLDYPSTIISTPEFYSELYLIVNTKKEYVNKKSKVFFIRWFQRKKDVLYINTSEKNPYIRNNKQKFIKVIK